MAKEVMLDGVVRRAVRRVVGNADLGAKAIRQFSAMPP
jgi:hypothetical protein